LSQAITYLMAGLWLMRQSPGLYLALITAYAALNYYVWPSSNLLLLGLVVWFMFVYWTISLAAFQVAGKGGGPLDFLKPRNAPLLGTILYNIFSMLWAMLASIPFWIAGSIAGGSILAGHINADELDPENQDEMLRAMAEGMEGALAAGPLIWVLTGMTVVTILFFFRFLSKRITVPVTSAIWDVEMDAADAHAGPRSGRIHPAIFWIFALTFLPMWVIGIFIIRVVPPESGVMLLFELAHSFATALPFVATVAYVHREVGPPPS